MDLIEVPNEMPKYLSEVEDEIFVGPTRIVSFEVISSPKTRTSVSEVATERKYFEELQTML